LFTPFSVSALGGVIGQASEYVGQAQACGSMSLSLATRSADVTHAGNYRSWQPREARRARASGGPLRPAGLSSLSFEPQPGASCFA
jgi:hypothetical protein